MNLGKDINEKLKKDDKKMVNVDVVTDVFENNPHYAFVVGIIFGSD